MLFRNVSRRVVSRITPDASKSWGSSYSSSGPDGECSQADFKGTGGDGLLYCFAAN
jgi:hypothetical protein